MTNNSQHKFFIYARKSTDDLSRQVRSIDDQLAELRELAKREHLDVVRTFTEKQTAKKPGRAIFNEMLDRIERGEAQGILAWHPDRLSRNSIDAGRIIWFIDTTLIQAMRFPTYQFDPSAQGKFALSIMLSQSKYYVDNLSENIRRGQRQKIKSGIWPMVAPIGYLNNSLKKTIYPDPLRGPLVRKAFELYATGEYTLDRLVESVNALGLLTRHGEPLSRPQYHRMLRNPIYYGIIEYNGERYQASHEPLVSQALFDAAARAAVERGKPRNPKFKPYLYRGLIRCGECGRLVTTETQKGNNYLRCSKWQVSCSQPYLREEKLAAQIDEAIARIILPQYALDWLATEFETREAADRELAKASLQRIRDDVKQLDQKLERLMNLYLEQVLTLPEYKDAKNKLIDELDFPTFGGRSDEVVSGYGLERFGALVA